MVLNIILIGSLTVAATARLTRLVSVDTITRPLRDALITRSKRAHQAGRTHALVHWIAALVHCAWCSGVWCSAVTTAYVHHITGWAWAWYPLSLAATAWCSGIAATWLDSPAVHTDLGPADTETGHEH